MGVILMLSIEVKMSPGAKERVVRYRGFFLRCARLRMILPFQAVVIL